MNKIYRIIWSKARNCYVVVSEIAKRSGKSSSSLNKKLIATFLAAGTVLSVTGSAWAGNNTVTIKGNGNSAPNVTNSGGDNAVIIGKTGATHGSSIVVIGDGAKNSTDLTSLNGSRYDYLYGDRGYHSDGGRIVYNGSNGIAIGTKAWSHYVGGDADMALFFGKSLAELPEGIAIGTNSYARNGSIMLGQHDYTGPMGDTTVEAAKNNKTNLSVAATTIGYASSNMGNLATLTGSYSVISDFYEGNKSSERNVGAVVYGSLNSIESKKTLQGDPASRRSGIANSVVGVANRTNNANTAMIFGAGNQISNSIVDVTPSFYQRPGKDENGKALVAGYAQNALDLQNKMMKHLQEDKGGSVIAIGTGNTADSTIFSQLNGVGNTLSATTVVNTQKASDTDEDTYPVAEAPKAEDYISAYNQLSGYANQGTDVRHVTVAGAANTIKNTTGAIVTGDNNSVTGSGIPSAKEEKYDNILLIGNNRTVTGAKNTVVLGSGKTTTTAENAVIIGQDANAEVDGGVALGKDSIASTPAGTTTKTSGYDPSGKDHKDDTTGTWVSTASAVSVGGGSSADGKKVTRQITNVAAGSDPTDAVNVAQLKAAMASSGGIHDYGVNSIDPDTDTNYENKGATGDNALAAGVSAKAEGIVSTAVGYNAHAIGGTALAVGTSVTATGNQSVAIGTSANAEKDSSIAIGTGVSAKGPNSIAIGTGVTAEGQGAIALGSNGALAKGNGSMAFGSGTTAGIREVNEETGAVTKTTYNDTVFGNGTTAIGGNSTAFGTGSKATGANSTAFGGGNTVASGTGATAFGLGTTAAGDYSTAFGRGGARALGPGATAFGEGTYSNGLLTGSFRVYSNAATAPHTYLHGSKGFQAYVNVNGRQIAVDGTKTALYMGRGTAAAIDWGSGMLFPVYLSKQGSPVVKIGGVLYFVDNARSGVMKQGTKATGHELQTYEGYDFVSSSTKPNSTAFGLGTMAIGASSTAFGDKTIAVGANSTAFGTRSQAIGDLATAFGTDTLAYGAESTAWGRYTAAIGPMATAFGNDTRAVKSSSLAFGNNTKAVGEHSTAWGYNTVADDSAGTTAWGKMTTANGPYATAWGMDGTKALQSGATAWGKNTLADGPFATAWGENTTAKQSTATAWGNGTLANYSNATAFGNKTEASGWVATAWGENTLASYSHSTAWGNKTTASQYATTAWGEDTQATYSHATAWGKSTKANGYVATAWGEKSLAIDSHSTAWGRDSISRAFATTSWGEMTQANSSHATSFGRDTIANKSFATAWGDETTADGAFATSFGKGTVAKGAASTSWGEFTLAGKAIYNGKEVLVHQPTSWGQWGTATRSGETITNKFVIQDPITKEILKEVEVKNGDFYELTKAGVDFQEVFAGTAFGQLTNASGSASTAFGQQTMASGDMSTAFGKDSKATKFAATAFGKATEASGDMSTAFGENTKAKAFATTAFGQNSVARGATSTAFGTNSEADGANSLAALGGKTGGTWGDPEQEGDSSQFGTWGGTASVAVGQGAVAMQDYTYAIGRSAEVTDTDDIAIGNDAKVWRTKGIAFGTDAKVAATNSIAIGNTVYVGKDGDNAADISNGIVIGNESNVFGEKSIAIGYGNTVRGKSSSVIGDPNEISGDNNIIHANNVNDGGVSNLVVVGHHDEGNTHTYLENSVALGANSYMKEIGGMPSITINGTQYDFAGAEPVGTVSVGAEGAERTITNVAAGRISATSTDAINGSQLYFAIQALNEKVVVESGDSSVNVDSKVEPEDAAGAGTTGSGTTTGGNTDAGNTESGSTTGGNDTTTTGGNTGATAGGDSAEIEPTRTTTYIVTANTTTAEAGPSDNLTVEDSNPGGDDKTHHYTIDLAKDIHVTNVTVDNSVKVGDKTTIEGDKITVGDTVIEGDQITTKTVNGDTINTKTINLGTYKKGGNTYNIATVEDGMDYAGDDGKAIHKNLAEQLDIVGGAADKASEYNIYTYNDGDKLRINLAKDIKGVDSVTVNKTVKVGDKTTIEGDKILKVTRLRRRPSKQVTLPSTMTALQSRTVRPLPRTV